MTSKSDNLKTNEFLRLRKLRLQQVREQSKDIAKKIRQRAKVEQLRHVTKVDINKEKEYLLQQEKLVNRLGKLYSKGLQNVGAGHKNACDVNQEVISEKEDLSKLRGKEAVAVLKRKKQEKLDEQKKVLDRKLQAREVANVFSREKFNVVANTLTKSVSGKSVNEIHEKDKNKKEKGNSESKETALDKSDPVTKNDMGTQWAFEEIPNEWEPNIPTLPIPNDDSMKNSADDNVEKSDNTKKVNLFALSDEMPSSLRGGVTSIPDDRIPRKPSLTLVSEYLQNRRLRLREPDLTHLQKKNADDLQSIKNTLLRMRASNTDGSVFPNICHVLDEQIIPVPCWRAEKKCEFCSHVNEHIPQLYQKITNNNNSIVNASTLRSCYQYLSSSFENPKACPRSRKCRQGHKVPVSGRSNNIEHSSKSNETSRGLKNKSLVTMYDHNTRDTKDMPHNVDRFVVRDQSIDDDAYSQALKEALVVDNDGKPHHILQQETRNRLAKTRQNVDKEYRDTLAFLNSLPKEKPAGSIRTAYMDGDRQQELKDRRQQKLQQAYKNIEKQCSKHHCKHARDRSVSQEQNGSKSKSPIRTHMDNNKVNRDFQYSWLPVPESDGNLAIHNIPNTIKDNKVNKPGNTVKFSSEDTYHEYRSRHKHTPPTKDADNEPNKRVVEAVIIQENSSLDSSFGTDTSSVENLQVKQDNLARRKTDKDIQLAEAERIIIYKVLESKKLKKHKTKKKTQNANNVERSYDPTKIQTGIVQQDCQNMTNTGDTDNVKASTVTLTQLKEGIYKSKSANGDNITSLYFSDDEQEGRFSPHNKNTNIEKEHHYGISNRTVIGENIFKRRPNPCDNCKSTDSHPHIDQHASAATSTSSFKTAVNDKANNVLLDGGCIKFVEEGGPDTGKFYVGASGFLKDDDYEVIIQLRKKEAEKSSTTVSKEKIIIETKPEKINEQNEAGQQSTTIQSNNEENKTPSTNVNEVEKPDSPLTEQCYLLLSTNINENIPTLENKFSTLKGSNEDSSKQDKLPVDPSEITDKEVSTSFRDTFAIPDNMSKFDPISKPVTSNYTQTTQNSPVPRPVLMHLSSSTSTTYMSPPELVLPRYLRTNGSDSIDDTYEPVLSKTNSQNTRIKNCKGRCVKCKKQERRSKVDTPPNSIRSTDQTTDNIFNATEYKKNTRTEFKDIRQHKCKNSSESKICSKQKFKRSSIENRRSNYTIISNKKGRITNNVGKVNLNPVIENYIKQLLALNKEGLKAIEVVNQECSVVNTPGSSIIDVPNNINKHKSVFCKQISLEQIKHSLKKQILKDVGDSKNVSNCTVKTTGSQTDKMIKLLYKTNRKRPVHKVKSFNISKQLIKTNKENRCQSARSSVITTSPCSVNSKIEKRKPACANIEKNNSPSKTKPTPRQISTNPDSSNSTSYSGTNKCGTKPFHSGDKVKASKTVTKVNTGSSRYPPKVEMRHVSASYPLQSHRATITSHSSESEASTDTQNRRNISTPPISISTQTNQVDSEAELMKLAENKLQNMEKIADLTEKCTKRLSNLAKVLEEVRRNKSLVYSQVSTSESTSDSDQRSSKKMQANINPVKTLSPTVEIQTTMEALSSLTTSPQETKKHDAGNIAAYVPILTGLPKPESFKSMVGDNVVTEQGVRNRGKPPPALTRINLKHVPEGFVIPHELSTVVEVDSPMSMKLKSHTTQIDNKHDGTDTESVDDFNLNEMDDKRNAVDTLKKSVDPSGLFTKFNISKRRPKQQSTDSSDDAKTKMMDLKHFNDIMLKPFITLQEYAKQYNLEELDGRSNLNGLLKDENHNEEFGSLHSEASLPDVMAELLKRNLISEPFKFETTSNVNSTTVSSESTLSLLALSRAHKDKKKSTMLVKNKENIAESSVSLSISSNPDLENAFQRLGMGWASSTLKKTKERLALSSSSNTSSSSLPQFKIKSFNYQDVPELSSLLNISNKGEIIKPQEYSIDTSKNALQQTSLTNSMTVKEFLANELANKITFSNKTNRNTTEDEFISLCETKMPDEIKRLSEKIEVNEKSADSVPSGTNNRARTSTPVQIYKSMTYHSTSSSNTSNGLFSNADDLSSVKGTNSNKNHSTSDKDDLTIPNYSLKMRKEVSKSTKRD